MTQRRNGIHVKKTLTSTTQNSAVGFKEGRRLGLFDEMAEGISECAFDGFIVGALVGVFDGDEE